MKTIVFSTAAARDLDRLPDQARNQITEGLVSYAVSGNGDVKKLKGRDGYRLRIGEYRVLFDEDMTTILAVYIGRRTSTTY